MRALDPAAAAQPRQRHAGQPSATTGVALLGADDAQLGPQQAPQLHRTLLYFRLSDQGAPSGPVQLDRWAGVRKGHFVGSHLGHLGHLAALLLGLPATVSRPVWWARSCCRATPCCAAPCCAALRCRLEPSVHVVRHADVGGLPLGAKVVCELEEGRYGGSTITLHSGVKVGDVCGRSYMD
jgi:hypothetical protein